MSPSNLDFSRPRILWLAILLGVAVPLLLKAPELVNRSEPFPGTQIRPANTGFAVGYDDALQLQAAWRYQHGFGYNAYHAPPGHDLGRIRYAYPAAWPPGVMWLMKSVMALGFQPHAAYMALALVLLVSGCLAWTMLGVKMLSFSGPAALGAFLFCFAFFYARGWIKLADMVMFALTPVYVSCWLKGLTGEKKPLALFGAALAVAAAIPFWNGAIYMLAAALPLFAWMLGNGDVKDRPRLLAIVFAWPLIPVGVFAAVQSYVRALAGEDFFGHTTKGFFLFQLNPASFKPLLAAAGASYLGILEGLRPALESFLPRAFVSMAGGVALSVLMITALCLGMSVLKGRAGEQRKWSPVAALAVTHFLALAAMLTWMSIRYQYSGLDAANWNMLVQAARFFHHLMPLLAMVWLIPMAALLKNGGGPKALKAAVAGLAAAGWLGLLVQRGADVRAMLFQPPPEVAQHPSNMVMADILKHPGRRHVVFDPNLPGYLYHGFAGVSAYPSIPDFNRLTNRKPLTVYVVVYSSAFASTWMGGAAENRNRARHIIRKLGLKKIYSLPGTGAVFAGEVPPFSKARK